MKASVSSPKYGWEDINRNSVGLIHSLEEDGDVGIAFCFRSKPFSCSVTDVEKVPPFEVGQEIHVMSSVTQPRLGWSNETPATVGKIVRIDMDGALNVCINQFCVYFVSFSFILKKLINIKLHFCVLISFRKMALLKGRN